ncbi:MAG TPA: class I SAM-dependent methyltransferase [Streptosporangiaceae bacterium]|nr:class I SAM-dependent methyltransferase [Streptosporangiaceae bacterium]
MDSGQRDAFAARMLGTLTGGALTLLISVGHRTGLFEAAARGPATSAGLASRAGLSERYVREWLGAMVTGRLVSYDPATGEYVLPPEHACFLTGDGASNIAPVAAMLRALGDLERCFAGGGGLPPAAFAPHFAAAGSQPGETWRRIYDEQLVPGFLGAVPGLLARLAAGITVPDVGCGTGHAVTVAARAFPASRFLGVDINRQVLAAAGAERARLSLGNAAFAAGDAATLPARPRFDLITAFDAVHDQHSPQQVLRRVRAALAPGGMFLMVDTKFSSDLAGNVGNPLAALCYAISLLYCVPVSLDGRGAGLGAMWGTERASQMLAEAGFGQVELLDSPRPQNCIYVCRP